MPATWFCIGFLVGMTLWTPLIVVSRIEWALARAEARIIDHALRVSRSGR